MKASPSNPTISHGTMRSSSLKQCVVMVASSTTNPAGASCLYNSREELAPRNVVARSIDDQLKKYGEKYVLLDISHCPRDAVLSHFPVVHVVPAAHYMCGRVRAGLYGETNIYGLFVVSKVACTGLHGANRLVSNSLLEALIFAQWAVKPSINHVHRSIGPLSISWAHPMLLKSLKDHVVEGIKQKTREGEEGVAVSNVGVCWFCEINTEAEDCRVEDQGIRSRMGGVLVSSWVEANDGWG